MFSSKCSMEAKGIMHSAKSQEEKKVLRDKQIENLSLNDFLGEQKSKKTLDQRIKCLNELRKEYEGRCDIYKNSQDQEEQEKFNNSCPGGNPGNYLDEIDKHIREIEEYIKNNKNKTVIRSSSEPDKVTPMVNVDRRINSAPGDLEGVRTKEEYINNEKYVTTTDKDGIKRFALGGKKRKTRKHKKKGKKKTMRKKGKKKTNKRKGKKKMKKRGKKKTKKRGKKSRK